MPGASPSFANHRQPTMMEVKVEGTTLREEDYDPADWTKIIGTYQGKSQSKAQTEDTNEERTETLPASTWRPTYRPYPAHLRATQQVKRKSRQMAPLPQHAIKVVFRSQGGLFLPNIQPQLLLRCLCEAAKIPMGEEVQLRVHPMNNTCTVATTNQEAALNLVKIRSITLNAKAYGMAAYIVPAADTVRSVISNAFWDETEEELLQDLQARNPETGILLARCMGKSKSILITFAQGPIPRRIIYYGGVHLCTPYRARPEACTNCRTPGHRYDVCPEPKIPRCPRCDEDHGEDRTQRIVRKPDPRDKEMIRLREEFEAKLEAKLTAKLAHFQQQMRDEFQQFLDKRMQTLEAGFPTLEARIDSLIDERFKILENKLDTFCTQLRTQMGLMVVEATNQMQAVPLPHTTHPSSTSQTSGQQNGR
ncbi:hypothetical protein HPB49_003844 [Dermacentor silvarum]|uniref:Uncharacterized protein n=1 Tax=Dermacentor silvarum TaxID=543639 RepID=A0ACB8CPA0_DERSI|nr:hypothetical protein HPB49_003844 [Dermacentor silvarum]